MTMNSHNVKLIILFFLELTVSVCYSQQPDVVNHLESKVVRIDIFEKEKLSRFFNEKKLIAVGEPNHFSKEVLDTKAAFFKFLVKDLGFNIIGLEENFASCLAINDYILNGTGDPNKLIKYFYSWPWVTQEVLNLIEWMRSYNLSEPDKKVKFYGFDMQQGYPAMRCLIDYFFKVDPTFYQTLDTLPVTGYMEKVNYKMDTSLIKEIRDTLKKNKLFYLKKSSEDDWNIAWQNTNILLQQNAYISIYEVERNTSYWIRERSKLRDKLMADNIQWILENERPTSKIMVWAHNSHISKGRYPSAVDSTMGEWLRAKYGENYYTIGVDFNEGEIHDPQRDGLGIYSFTPLEERELPRILEEKNAGKLFLDFEFASQDSTVNNWLKEGDYQIKYNEGYSEIKLPTMFDGLIFIDKISPSTLLVK